MAHRVDVAAKDIGPKWASQVAAQYAPAERPAKFPGTLAQAESMLTAGTKKARLEVARAILAEAKSTWERLGNPERGLRVRDPAANADVQADLTRYYDRCMETPSVNVRFPGDQDRASYCAPVAWTITRRKHPGYFSE